MLKMVFDSPKVANAKNLMLGLIMEEGKAPKMNASVRPFVINKGTSSCILGSNSILKLDDREKGF